MIKVYHGMSADKGVIVAKSGELRSSLQQKIVEVAGLSPRQFKRRFKDMTLEQAAWSMLPDRHFEYSGRTSQEFVAVGTSIKVPLRYALENESINGYIILCLGITKASFNAAIGHHLDPKIKFLARTVSLDNLAEIYLTPKAEENFRHLIVTAFERYHPLYYTISPGN